MNVEELKARFESVANSDTEIESFVFDDLSSINTTRRLQYKAILMKPPNSVITPFQDQYNEPLWENFTITFYIFDLWDEAKQKTTSLDQAYRECDVVADKYLKNILLLGSNEYSLIGDKSVTKERGHHQHVNQLIGVSYTFTLRVFNSLCYGLGQPTNLVATAISTTRIDLSWTDNATTEDGYRVYRSSDGINWTLLASIAADSTSYSDTGLTVNTLYYYKVVAHDTNGEGVPSNVVAMRTDNTSTGNATQVIKDTAGDTLYTNIIPIGTSEDQEIADSLFKNSEGTTISTLKAEETVVGSDVDNIDSDGSTVPTPVGKVFISTPVTTPVGIAYQRPQLTGQLTSFRTNDDAWHLDNGTYDYTPPVFPVSYSKLDTAAVSPFTTLLFNNAFSNKNRFTDSVGEQDYDGTGGSLMDYVIDHLTGLGWYRIALGTDNWNTVIDAASASTQNGFSDWRIPNRKELEIIQNSEVDPRMNYSPFTGVGVLVFRTSTTRIDSTLQDVNIQTGSGASVAAAKGVSRNYIICRNHY